MRPPLPGSAAPATTVTQRVLISRPSAAGVSRCGDRDLRIGNLISHPDDGAALMCGSRPVGLCPNLLQRAVAEPARPPAADRSVRREVGRGKMRPGSHCGCAAWLRPDPATARSRRPWRPRARSSLIDGDRAQVEARPAGSWPRPLSPARHSVPGGRFGRAARMSAALAALRGAGWPSFATPSPSPAPRAPRRRPHIRRRDGRQRRVVGSGASCDFFSVTERKLVMTLVQCLRAAGRWSGDRIPAARFISSGSCAEHESVPADICRYARPGAAQLEWRPPARHEDGPERACARSRSTGGGTGPAYRGAARRPTS